jgi:hypothetical protein
MADSKINPGVLLVNTAAKHVGESKDVNGCAQFVSDMVAEAGIAASITGAKWSRTSSVPAMVAEFDDAHVYIGASIPFTALSGDLVVFGKNEHVMIYAGNQTVIGTGGTSGATKVVSVPATDVYATSGGRITRVLYTGLGGAPPVVPASITIGPVNSSAISDAVGSIFGNFAWVPILALNAGVLILAAALIWAGLKQTVGAAEGTV